MNYTLLIIWSDLKPDLYHSDTIEHLENIVKEHYLDAPEGNKYYIFKNTGRLSKRIVNCENKEITYL